MEVTQRLLPRGLALLRANVAFNKSNIKAPSERHTLSVVYDATSLLRRILCRAVIFHVLILKTSKKWQEMQCSFFIQKIRCVFCLSCTFCAFFTGDFSVLRVLTFSFLVC